MTENIQTKQWYRKHISPGKVDFYEQVGLDLIMGDREGVSFQDKGEKGKSFINCHCNGGVFNLGHRNQEVIATLKTALDHYDIGNHHLISDVRARLAHRLSATLDHQLPYTVFNVSGGETVDFAIKLARGATKRAKIISANGGYHGHTGYAVATGDLKYRASFQAETPGFVQIPFDDLAYATEAIDDKTAAVIFETIPATLGMPVAKPDFFIKVKDLCTKNGALLILDEVQTGFGRTGSFWGFSHFQVVPDMIVIGKGISGGIYPLTATMFRDDLIAFFDEDPFLHISTFGGSELGCIVGEKVVEISSEPAFLARVRESSSRVIEGLKRIKNDYRDLVAEIRGMGLMLGLRLVAPELAKLLCKLCIDQGLFVVYANNDTSVLQFLPPLTISDAEIDEALKRLERAVAALRGLIGG